MAYEYLASVQSAVRRVNERIKTLAEKFGDNSAVVNKVKTQLDVLMPDNMRYKDGLVQIGKPSDIYGNDEKMQALADLDKNVKTWGEYRKEYEKEYETYQAEASELKEKQISMPDFIQAINNLDKALREVPSDSLPDNALKILKQTGKRKTYAQLFKVAEILRKKGFI